MSDLFPRMYIRGANEGDPADALTLLQMAADTLEAGRPLPEPLRHYLVDSLRKIVSGMKPQAALNLNKRRGLKSRVDAFAIRNDVETELCKPGTTREAAYAAVAERHYCDPSTVKKLYLGILRAEAEQ